MLQQGFHLGILVLILTARGGVGVKQVEVVLYAFLGAVYVGAEDQLIQPGVYKTTTCCTTVVLGRCSSMASCTAKATMHTGCI
jgi:hypothetical protein